MIPHPTVLENERVLLRPMEIEDIEHLIPFSQDEPELWDYSLTRGDGRDNLKKYIALAIEGRNTGLMYPFIVYDKKYQKYAGSTRFYDIQPYHNTVQLGYTWYGKKYQGTGLNKNCKYLMLEFAFDTLKVDRVEFRADNNNKRSIAAMKSLGCTVEGVLRQNCKSPEGRRDSIVLSILRTEWHESIKSSLQSRI